MINVSLDVSFYESCLCILLNLLDSEPKAIECIIILFSEHRDYIIKYLLQLADDIYEKSMLYQKDPRFDSRWRFKFMDFTDESTSLLTSRFYEPLAKIIYDLLPDSSDESTSLLTSSLTNLIQNEPLSDHLYSILEKHNWNGFQFSGPFNIKELKKALLGSSRSK